MQARRQVRRLANNVAFLRVAFADQVASHHLSGRDAHPHGERRGALARIQSADRLDQVESRTDGPLGVVFVRPRPAEISQCPVAHVFGEIALPACDGRSAAVTVSPQQLAHILRIEPRRKFRRADEIDEHHRELSALCRHGSGAGDRLRRGSRSGRCAEGRDRVDQLPAVAKGGDTDFLEVIAGQAAQ